MVVLLLAEFQTAKKIGLNNGFWQLGTNTQKGRILFGPKMAETSLSGPKRARASGGEWRSTCSFSAKLSFRPIVISANCDIGQLRFSANRSKRNILIFF
jgi:hypothetical protein